MIYIIVRLIIFAITALILFLINKKKKIGRKAVITVLVIVAVVCETSALLGLDNHYLNYAYIGVFDADYQIAVYDLFIKFE